ncbi:hypothetical protein ACFYY3_13955 [Streptomyces sp. NPDC001812]|uniref:Aromatic ring-opening dioxygenase LigA n=1 Tax=Streptomyces cathayae TaxID=3031124 RepID=A0ABY8K6J4_9ACTN|nr:hypothetical protein [Streptomyces sp. HUAS 5]WGD42476.1 hypothetical protein PYS65_21345 [Streptomyces sp. HUAS 5]
MPPAVSASRSSSRHSSRRVSRRSSAVLRLVRLAAMGVVTVLILIAGVWASWGTAQYVMLTKGRERGTVAVTSCGAGTCKGAYTPLSPGSQPRAEVVLEDTVAVAEGRTYTVLVKPGGTEVVRSGPAGVLHAWVPLGGALMLASVVVAGGLLRTRPAWVMGVSGVALVTAAFLVI